MRTVQVSLGELIEAMYDDLAETYEAKNVAREGAAAIANELLAKAERERVTAGILLARLAANGGARRGSSRS